VKGRSIQKRLLLAVVISQVLLALGLTCAGVLYTRRRVMASLDESLRATATIRRAGDDAIGLAIIKKMYAAQESARKLERR